MTTQTMTAYFNRFTLEMTEEQCQKCYHLGDCYHDIVDELPNIRVNHIDPADLRAELAKYGAWDDDELQDHQANLIRIVWLAAADTFI